jgi:hypothetical protein
MGYRSYGQLIFPTSQLDAYHHIAGAHKDNSLDMWDEQNTIDLKYTKPWHQSKYIQDNDSLTILDYSGWKWYESYPDIQAIENFMGYLELEGHTWLYWRKGEDWNDVTMMEGTGYDVPFSLSDGYTEAVGIDSLHGWEDFDIDEKVYYYSLQIEDETKNTKKWNDGINKLKHFMEDELKLELTNWESRAKTWGDNKKYLIVKIEWGGPTGLSIGSDNLWVVKLRKYLDDAEIGGSDEQWHLFLTKKEAGSQELEVVNVHGPNDPWDYDLYPQMNVGWNWSPRKADPPNCINYYLISA